VTTFRLISRSLTHYWRTNLAVVLGVAVAVAVLAGALLVGASVRSSLRELATGRLGQTDQAILSTGLFREALASEVDGVPVLMLEGIVVHEPSGTRASRVQVYGIDERFWKFHGSSAPGSADREALLGEPLARELGAKPGDAVLVRLPQQSDIPAESLHGRKEDPGRTIRFLAGQPIPSPLGEFTLRPRQGAVRAVFVPLPRLQRDLRIGSRVNTILLEGDGSLEDILKSRYALGDVGVKLRILDPERGFAIETESAVVSDSLADTVAATARGLGLRSTPMLSYLANTIRVNGREVPYSLVTAMNLEGLTNPDGIALNEWAARELQAKPGDQVTLEYYLWQADGNLITRSADFTLQSVLPMKGIAADRDLSPEYPGISDADTIGDWDPPFPMHLKRIRPADEDYWDRYRATPKAFVALNRGQELWQSRFGKLTSIRIAGGSPEAFEESLRRRLNPFENGFNVEPVRAAALQSSQGATDFGEYFSYFSFFLVISALLLTGLFFRLGVEQRLREIGTLRATGFSSRSIRRLLAAEGIVLATLGGLVGVAAALLYGGFILYGLRTWWVDAVGTRMLRLHVDPGAMIAGMIGGLVAAVVAVLLSLRAIRKRSPRSLLSGVAEPAMAPPFRRRRAIRLGLLSALGSAMLLGATAGGFIQPAGGFFGAGALLLIASLSTLWSWLSGPRHALVHDLHALGQRGTTYRPGRSILCIALIASATFLIVSIDSFRRDGLSDSRDPKSGSGGFPLLAESALPIFYDLDSKSGRDNVGLTASGLELASFYPFRLRPGDDASCLNLYQPVKPRFLGVPGEFARTGRFAFSGTIEPADNPWLLLESPAENGAIPAIVDANSLTYVLHRKLGDEMVFQEDGRGPVRVRFVATLRDSIFQSEILISEAHFTTLFPDQQGHRYYLIETPPERVGAVTASLEEGLSDYGIDVEGTAARLAEFHRVENTYLSTFQALGGLGLVLGTVGLGAVLLRNVLERRREVALLRAVGYRPEHLRRLILAENMMLLISGLGIGTVCALIAIAPAWLERGGRLPVLSISMLLIAVFATGLLASVAAVRAVRRAPIATTLRAE
jgi:ABC-type lipoprotein release transport system permease subunit